jgi:phosphoribosylformimino-5-aminoimidazole carboxamide ribotide isomerase
VRVIPAIDLIGGAAVRLVEGKRESAQRYHDDPVELALDFAAAGAERVHVVDLDGAFAGAPAQTALIAAICRRSRVPVQVGGGLRDAAALDAVFAAGARLAVLGTAAIRDPAFVEAACRAHPGRVIVAVDARDGMVAVDGWLEVSDVPAAVLAERAAGWGAAAILYTDIARDGTHGGPNVAATAALAAAVRCEVIASGGVGTLEHLAALRDAGIRSVVVGRALYERRFTLVDAIATARPRRSRC